MKLNNFIKITTATIIMASTIGNTHAGNGRNKDKNEDPTGGFIDAVFIADSLAPVIPPVASNSADSKGQIVFYGEMDLSMFTGTYDNGVPCSPGLEDGASGLSEGIIVIYPQSTRNPGSAELIFWYRDVLQSGDEIQHLLTMQGRFVQADNWPPSEAVPQNTVELNYWEFAAENRKAQRQDCSGSSEYPVGPWSVTVSRVVPLP